MSSTWDLYDSYNAMELSSLAAKQSMLESTSRASIPPKDREQRMPGSTIEKSKISFISFFKKWNVSRICMSSLHRSYAVLLQYYYMCCLSKHSFSFFKNDVCTCHCK